MGLLSFLFKALKVNVQEMKTRKDTEGLIKALHNKRNVFARMEAARALGDLGDPKAIDPLVDALKDRYRPVRDFAAEALGKLGGDPRGVEVFLEYVKDSKSMAREEGATALGKIGDRSAAEALIALLNDESFFVRQSAMISLGKIGDMRATEPLIPLLKDEDKDIRESASSALGSLGDVRAVEPLIQTLKDESPRVRYHAADSLGKLGDARAVEALIEATKDKGWLGESTGGSQAKKKSSNNPGSTPRRWVRQKAIEALGTIGDARAIPALTEALNDKHEPVRETARQALEKLPPKPA